MHAQKGFSSVILIIAIAGLGLIGFFLLNKPNSVVPIVQEKQSQPPQQIDNSSRQIRGGHGSNKEAFYNKDGITLQHYWPGEPSFSNEETEILLFNESSSNVEVKSFKLDYSVEGKTYPHKSGTWEKFSTIQGWDRTQYLNISAQHYQGQSLVLSRGEKGKLHWHINFGENPLDGKQTIKVDLMLQKNGESIPISQTFTRPSGEVFSKEDH